MPGPTISVIICAYADARWDALLAAVASAQGQTRPPSEVIVIIDHNPGLLARATAALPRVRVAGNHAEPGLSGARNTGVQLARGEVLAFLDDDAAADATWLAQLAGAYSDAGTIGVGGFIEPVWANGRPAWFPDEFDWVVGCSYRGLPTEAGPIRNLIGANMSLRRTVFESVGGFRSSLGRLAQIPAGCEETELCIRARQGIPGALLHYNPSARVRHAVPASRANWRYFVSRCYGEGRSKALVARLVGANQGLSSERAYTLQVLPRGVLRGLQSFLRRGDLSGLLRAGAIVLGFSATACGYLLGAACPMGSGRRAAAAPTLC